MNVSTNIQANRCDLQFTKSFLSFCFRLASYDLMTFYIRSIHINVLFDFCQTFYQQTIVFDFMILYILLRNVIESRAIVVY